MLYEIYMLQGTEYPTQPYAPLYKSAYLEPDHKTKQQVICTKEHQTIVERGIVLRHRYSPKSPWRLLGARTR